VITSTVDVGGASVLLLAPVRGLSADARAAAEALERYRPEAVGAGVSSEELEGLVQYFIDAPAEPVVPLAPTELSEVRGLCRFGEVRVPNPAFLQALRWGRSRLVPVEPLDPGEEEAATLFTEHIGYVELVRRTVREHRLGRTPPTPSSADAFALDWDRSVAGGRGSRRFASARDDHLVRGALRLAQGHRRIAVVVDRERYDSVRSKLAEADPARDSPSGRAV
jgi:hypothetical protein